MDDLPRPAKRPRLSSSATSSTESQSPSPPQPPRERVALASLHRSITPPRSSHNNTPRKSRSTSKSTSQNNSKPQVIPSPFQLTQIRDLPRSSNNNVDTIGLRDILGDPMIRECWQFNYLFDVDFLMSQFDEDVRALVQVKVVHGSWKREAPNRVRIDVRLSLLLASLFCSIERIACCMAGLTASRKLAHDIRMRKLSWPTCLSLSGRIIPR